MPLNKKPTRRSSRGGLIRETGSIFLLKTIGFIGCVTAE